MGVLGHISEICSISLLLAGIDPEILKVVGQVAGIGGIAIGALILLFRDIIRKNIFPSLVKQQAYKLLVLIVVLVWSVAIAGIVAWVLVNTNHVGKASNSDTAKPALEEFQLAGWVRDKEGNGITGADVSVIGGIGRTQTDTDGYFLLEIKERKDGPLKLRASKTGYAVWDGQIENTQSNILIRLESELSSLAAERPIVCTDFQTSNLTFDVKIFNPTKSPLDIERIGVLCKVDRPLSDCRSESGILPPGPGFNIPFHIRNKRTSTPADIRIVPNGVFRFRITPKPDDSGVCDSWAAHISPFVIFRGGKIYDLPDVEPKKITHRDIDISEEDRKILADLQLNDSNTVVIAIEKLSTSAIHRDSIAFLLEAKLRDREGGVRAAAAKAAGQMNLTSLAPQIASLLKSAQPRAVEKPVYAEALGKLGQLIAVDALVACLLDPEHDSVSSARDALIALDSAVVSDKVRPLLFDKHWALKKDPERVKDVNDALCKIMIYYRDMKSVPLLSELFRQSQVTDESLSYIRRKIDGIHKVNDPFILATRPALAAALESSDRQIRQTSIDILCLMGEDSAKKAVEKGLGDPERSVRVVAAHRAADLGYTDYVDRITTLYDKSIDAAEKEAYCAALKKLNVPCK
jgi:FOG: HEAT repeat